MTATAGPDFARPLVGRGLATGDYDTDAKMGNRSLLRLCHTDGSYLSASDRRVHFGLGSAEKVDTLTVHWPSGQTDTRKNVPANQQITLIEGGRK